MPIIRRPLSEVKLSSLLQLWGSYIYCVYEIPQIQSSADVANVLAEGIIYGYGSYPTDEFPTQLVKGTCLVDFEECKALFDQYNGVKTDSIVFANTVEIKYGPNNTLSLNRYSLAFNRDGGHYPDDTEYLFGRVAYEEKSNEGTWTYCWSEYNTDSISIKGNLTFQPIFSFNGGNGGFIRFKEDGVYKYVRVYVRILYKNYDNASSPDGEPIVYIGSWDIGNPLSDRGLNWFGCPAFEPLTIDKIANGTATDKPVPFDPYSPGGETEPGGGEGDFDDTSVPIDFPPMPTLSAVDTGFVTLFNPTEAQLKSLSSYMWSDLFDVEGWKKIFANPMDAILGLTIVPVAVPNAGTGVVTVGNISTGISMNKAAGQYVEVDCGTLNVNEYWGAYLDYDPYTKAEIYLPFIGIHALSTDDIMKKPVHVKYRIDLLSGACCAYVKCGDSVLYSFVGQCSCSIPVTSSDWTNIINGALSIAGAIGSMVATGGASAPMAAGTIASAAVNALKPTIEKSGSMGGMGGMLGVQQPYLILTRPRQALPTALNTYSGYPSFMTKGLGELSGFTVVDSIHLENIPATGAELSEIESLLKEGVIL